LGGVLGISAVCIWGLGLLEVERAASLTASNQPVEATPDIVHAETEPEPVPTVAASSTPPAEAPPVVAPVYDTSTDPASITYPTDWPQSELDNAHIWVEQQFIIADCMADQGFDYTWTLWWERDPMKLPASPARSADEVFALYGDTGAGPNYRWNEAGCVGYAVHVTGQDNNH
jgi:hypothetical protein